MAQQYQTIQDPLAPIVSPYKRLPQLTLTANKPDIFGTGADFNFFGSGTDFSYPTLVNGKRLVLFPSVSYPMRNAFGYITPKIGIHHTRYYLDALDAHRTRIRREPCHYSVWIAALRSIAASPCVESSSRKPLSRVSIMFMCRSGNRISLPNFDSAKTDFSFAQMLTENRFSGSDRINDANQVTFALTSRLIEPGYRKRTSARCSWATVSFIDRRIALEAPNTVPIRPDFIAAITGFLTPTISTDSSMQFDQRVSRRRSYGRA